MPNHVFNRLTFFSNDSDMTASISGELFRHILMSLQGNDPDRSYGSVDFNVLVPMPDGYMDDGRWYEWAIENWGTKWNAYDCGHNDATNQLWFNTAWSGAHKIARLISKRFPETIVFHEWADSDDIGGNVGKRYYNRDIMFLEEVPEPYSTKAYDMAASILDIDLEDYGLALGSDGLYHSIFDD